MKKWFLLLLIINAIPLLSQPESPIFGVRGNVGIITTIGYDEIGLRKGYRTLEYYQNDRIIKYIHKSWGEIMFQGEYIYNASDQRELIEHYRGLRIKSSKVLKDNRRSEMTHEERIENMEKRGASIRSSTINYYKNNGRLKKTVDYLGKISSRPNLLIEDITYDHKGRLQKYVIKKPHKMGYDIICIHFEWNEFDQCISKKTYLNCDKLKSIETFDWSDHKREFVHTTTNIDFPYDYNLSRRSLMPHYSSEKFAYTLDRHGNWIEMFKFTAKGKRKRIYKREIQYN